MPLLAPPFAGLRRAIAVLALLASATVVAGCTGPSPDDPVTAFLRAWQRGNLDGLDLLAADGRPLAGDAATRTLADTEGDLAARRPALTRPQKARVHGSDALTRVGVTWPLPGGRSWTYDTTVNSRKSGDRWRVFFGPATVHPDLHPGERLTLKTSPAPRGTVLAADGTPVVSEIPVVYVGIEPQYVEDVNALVQRLDLIFRSVKADVDVAGLPAKLQAAKPDAFVDVVTLRQTDYAEIERDLRSTHGVTTRTGKLSLPMTRTFGRALLGVSGPATKELIDASGGALKAGDVAGLTGLQKRYDAVLRGTPGLTVVARSGATPLFTADPVPGGQVRTTLDVRTQQAAEAALAGTALRSALVAVRVSDGAVLAAANGPGAAGYNLAFLGEIAGPPLGVDPAAAGFGAAWRIGADMFAGRATATGVVGPPLVYAGAAAAVARGHWRQPVLVTEPAPEAPAPEGPAVTGPLTVPTVSVGVRGDIAYCLYVEGAGADVTGPLADAFVQQLAGFR